MEGVKSAMNRKTQSHKLEGIKIGKYLWMKFQGSQAPQGANNLKSVSVPKEIEEFLY